MKRALFISFLIGVTIALAGSAWSIPILVVVMIVLLVGICRMDSHIMAKAYTHVSDGVALTYDDGPDPESTPALLDLLREYGARASFFLIGDKARAHPEIVRRILAEGHVIGNHSQAHSLWTNFFWRGAMHREMARCQDTLKEITGDSPILYRPPFGLMNPFVEPALTELNLGLIGWSIRSLDTVRTDAAERVRRRLKSGAIVLLHDGGIPKDRVLATSREILDELSTRGLTTTTISKETVA
jgi:peptidoglycan/xylan/chitin deacetylase (PgdA/CDA1 family)